MVSASIERMGYLEKMKDNIMSSVQVFIYWISDKPWSFMFFIVFFMSIQAICSEIPCPEAPIYCRAREKGSSLTGYLSEPDWSSLAEVSVALNIYENAQFVWFLQTQGIEVSAEMDFLGQQNIMLDLENKSLKQRLESVSQEHVIKRGEYVYAMVASIVLPAFHISWRSNGCI